MNKNDNVEKEIQKTLDMFEQADSLPENPYFYTRVQARLDEGRREKPGLFAVLKPALLAMLFVLNLSTAFWYLGSSNETPQTSSRQELVEMLSGDFNKSSEKSDLFNVK